MTMLPFAFVAYISSTFFSDRCKFLEDDRRRMRDCIGILAICIRCVQERAYGL